MISWRERTIAAVLSVAATGGLMWHLVATGKLSAPEAAFFGLFVCCLLWALLLCVLNEPDHKPVLAPLLERYVLNPLGNRLEQRRLEKWREEGRAQARAEIRACLKQRGLNPDDFLSPERF